MAWTAPRTWVTGEIPSAAMFNAQIRDNFLEEGPAKVAAAGDFLVGGGANFLRRIPIAAVDSVLVRSLAGTFGWLTQTVPSGTITFFDGTACPSGWTIVAAARGRAIVGLPSGGTLAGTVGTALTNLQTRTITAVPTHVHGAGSLAADSAGPHTHTIYYGFSPIGDAPRNSAQNASDVRATLSAGDHTHTASGTSASTGSASVDVTNPYIQYLVCSKD